MNAKINAGVVSVIKFVSSKSKEFSSYIEYMDRDAATRNANVDKYVIPELEADFKQFNEYMEYMHNPLKTSELFTKEKNSLTQSEKQEIKKAFTVAQNNGSLMWQTVISFDNQWLEQNGICKEESGAVDQISLQRAARKGVEKMLIEEGLDNSAIWSAAIHYNTDNLHVHVAIVEPVPMRDKMAVKIATIKKEYLNNLGLRAFHPEWTANEIKNIFSSRTPADVKRYYNSVKEVIEENRLPVKLGNSIGLDNDGNVILSVTDYQLPLPDYISVEEYEDYRGKWKQKSIEQGKSAVVNDIMQNQEYFAKINQLKNNNIIDAFRKANFKNAALLPAYIDIYKSLPDNRRLWKYNNNALKNVRPKIDAFVNKWIKENCFDDYMELLEKLKKQENLYNEAYGGKSNQYKENQIKDMYTVLGNSVIKSMKSFAFESIHNIGKENVNDEVQVDHFSTMNKNDNKDDVPEIVTRAEEKFNGESQFNELKNDDFLDIMERRSNNYISDNAAFDEERVNEWMQLNEPKSDDFLDIEGSGNNDYISDNSTFDEDSFNREMQYNTLKNNPVLHTDEKNIFSELKNEKIKSEGKRYYAEFTDDYKKAKEHMYKSKSKEANYELAYELLAKEAKDGNALAIYDMALMHRKGFGLTADIEKSQLMFLEAADGFIRVIIEELKENKNEHSKHAASKSYLKYRVGKMYQYGYGYEKNMPKAFDIFTKTENECAYSKYSSANFYYMGEVVEKNLKEALKRYEDVAKLTIEGKSRMPYSIYKTAEIYEKLGEMKTSEEYYIEAFKLFVEMEKETPDDQLQYRIGCMHQLGKGTEIDLEKAKEYLALSASQCNVYAQYQLGIVHLTNQYGVENIHLAISYFEKAAESGNAYAQYQLGTIYLRGEGVEVNYPKAISFLEDSSGRGNEFAQYRLGVIHLTDKYGVKDVPLAISYLEQAAEQGNHYALYRLGKTYCFGVDDDLEADVQKGLGYFNRAAEAGSDYAKYQLGLIYLKGDITEADYPKAISFLEDVAEHDNVLAQYEVGMIYLTNTYGVENIPLGISYLEKAAALGYDKAYYKLGMIYLAGEIVEENYPKAISFLKSSADKGNEMAQYQLGIVHLTDAYGAQDIPLAISCLEKLSENGNAFAQCKLGIAYYFGIENALDADESKGLDYLNQAARGENEFAQQFIDKIKAGFFVQRPSFEYKNLSMHQLSNNLERLCRTLGRDFKTVEQMQNEYYFKRLELLQNNENEISID